MTRAGWSLLVGAAVVALTGRLLGLEEVVALGLCGLGLLVGAAVWMRLRERPPKVSRRISPPEVSVGEPVVVRLAISNEGRRRSPMMTLVDPIARHLDTDPPPNAVVTVGPLSPGAPVSATYLLDTPQRGVITLGPMRLECSDPFGLLTRSSSGPGFAQLLVLPRVDEVAAPGGGRSDDPLGVVTRTPAPSPAGEEFATLRAYVPGDDLRKVHWATSARRDVLMVRRDDRPWQARTTIVLDVRASEHDASSLEAAVSASASVATAATRRGDELRLVTTGGLDSLSGSGEGHLGVVLRELALVAAGVGGSLAATIGAVHNATPGGTLVVITSSAVDLAGIAPRRTGQRGMVTVVVPLDVDRRRAASDLFDDEPTPTIVWDGRGQVVVRVADEFAPAWQAVMGRPVTSPIGGRRR